MRNVGLLLIFLSFYLIGCTKGQPEFEDLGLSLDISLNESSQAFNIYSLPGSITIGGQCHPKYSKIYVACDSEQAWVDVSLFGDQSDTDCLDRKFSFVLGDVSDLCVMVDGVDSSHALYIRAAGPDEDSDHLASSLHYINDHLPPAVTLEQPSGGELFKGSPNYNIKWTASDNYALQEATTVEVFDGSNWEVLSSTAPGTGSMIWDTQGLNGFDFRARITVYDHRGLATTVTGGSFTIDSRAPDFSSFSIASSDPTSSQNFDLVQDASGYEEYCINENDSSETSCSWIFGVIPSSFTVSAGDGSKTISIWVRDLAGNVSGPLNDSARLDQTAPSLSQISISNGDSTNSREFVFTHDASEYDFYCLLENSVDGSSCSWIAGAIPSTISVSPGDGAKTISLWVQDGLGNTSSGVFDWAVLDQTAPPVSSFSITNGSPTNSQEFYFTHDASGYDSYCLLENDSNSSSCSWTGGLIPASYSVSAGDGVKTLSLWVRDSLGNTSNEISDSAILDTAGPDLTNISITNGDPTNSRAFNFTHDASNYAFYCLQESSALYDCTWMSGSVLGSLSISSPGDGVKSVYLFVKDLAGNITGPASDNSTLDETAPTGFNIISFTTPEDSDSGAYLTGGTSLTVNWSASTGHSGYSATLSKNSVQVESATLTAGATNINFLYVLQDGSYSVSIEAFDESGNVTSADINFVRDTQPPDAFSIVGVYNDTSPSTDTTADNILASALVPEVKWQVSGGAYRYVLSVVQSDGVTIECGPTSATVTDYRYYYYNCELDETQTYKILVTAVDVAGNTTQASNNGFSFALDLTPPGAFTVNGIESVNLADTTKDQYLLNDNYPKISWSPSSGADLNGYDISIYDSAGLEVCSQYAAVGVTGLSLSSCYLTDSFYYELEVIAVDTGGNRRIASNGRQGFTVFQSTPGAFKILGVTDSGDSQKDAFLTDGDGTSLTLHWTQSAFASGNYRAAIYDSADLATPLCGGVASESTLSHAFSSCTFNTSSTYVARVEAIDGSNTRWASNDSFSFVFTNGETPRVNLPPNSGAIDESELIRVEVTLNVPSSISTHVNIDTSPLNGSVEDLDYVGVHKTLVFAPGETQKSVLVGTIDDLIAGESGEGVRLVLSSPSAGLLLGDSQYDISITDDDRPAFSGIAKISNGIYHSCGITVGGDLYCWGSNIYGQLGTGTQNSSPFPVLVSSISNIQKVGVGDYFTCALDADENVYCWGYNSSRLGIGTNNPAILLQPSSSYIAITGASDLSVGDDFACAVKNGGLYCWGVNNYGKLGTGDTIAKYSPTEVFAEAVGVTDVEAGYYHACAIKGGEAYCWGQNSFRQLGTGDAISYSTPKLVVGLGGGVADLALGRRHSCAYLPGSGVYCWGYNYNYSLGSPTLGYYSSPVATTLSLGTASIVEIGSQYASYHTCALLDNGTMKCWGSNTYGELGNGHTHSYEYSADANIDQLASEVGTSVSQMSLSEYSTCAVLSSGTAKCWGLNNNSSLGFSSNIEEHSPRVMFKYSNLSRIEVAGASYAPILCALDSSRDLRCMGMNSTGALGDGTSGLINNKYSLGAVALTNVTDFAISKLDIIYSNYSSVCAVLTDQTAWCWGYGGYGKLGNGIIANQNTPVQVSGLSQVSAIGVGFRHSCAIDSDGVICWGDNNSGQLGDGGSGFTATPSVYAIPVGTGIKQIAVVDSHTCALLNSGEVRCWGLNDRGQLGISTSIHQSSIPVTVSGFEAGSGVAEIGGFNRHVCARLSTGRVRCWGDNSNGNLGDPTAPLASPIPVLVKNVENAVELSIGHSHNCVKTADKKFYCWGRSLEGQIGTGLQTNYQTAVLHETFRGDSIQQSLGAQQSCWLVEPNTTNSWVSCSGRSLDFTGKPVPLRLPNAVQSGL